MVGVGTWAAEWVDWLLLERIVEFVVCVGTLRWPKIAVKKRDTARDNLHASGARMT